MRSKRVKRASVIERCLVSCDVEVPARCVEVHGGCENTLWEKISTPRMVTSVLRDERELDEL